jgi:hypothetical protein
LQPKDSDSISLGSIFFDKADRRLTAGTVLLVAEDSGGFRVPLKNPSLERKNMNKSLVVVWESYKDSKANVIVSDNPKQANIIATGIRNNRRRRVDVVQLDGEALKRLTS